jgi:hypothetical protein
MKACSEPAATEGVSGETATLVAAIWPVTVKIDVSDIEPRVALTVQVPAIAEVYVPVD